MRTRALLAFALTALAACAAPPPPPVAIPPQAPRLRAEADLLEDLERMRPFTYGASCGLQGDEVPLARLVARLSAERRLDEMQVLLGHPSPVVRAYGVAAWVLEPPSLRPPAVNDAIAYMRSDTTTDIAVCEGCTRSHAHLGPLVNELMAENEAWNPVAALRRR
jgi:hypothetical protein